MMKKTIQTLMMAVTLLALPLTFTSCEDILGKWEKPVPNTVVEEAKVLGAALETGATVSITYTISGTSYIATFTKNADDTYTLVSNVEATASTRGLTRTLKISAISPSLILQGHVNFKPASPPVLQVLNFKVIELATTPTPLIEVSLDVESGAEIKKTLAAGCAIMSLSINDVEAPVTMQTPLSFGVIIRENPTTRIMVSYNNNEGWKEIIYRYKESDYIHFYEDDDHYISIRVNKNNDNYYLVRNNTPPYTYVKSNDQIITGGDNISYYITDVTPPVSFATYDKIGNLLAETQWVSLSTIPGGSWDDFFSFLNGENYKSNDAELLYYKQDDDDANNLWLFCGDAFVEKTGTYDASKTYSFKQAKDKVIDGVILYYFDGLTWENIIKMNPIKIGWDDTNNVITLSGTAFVLYKGGKVQLNDVIDASATYRWSN